MILMGHVLDYVLNYPIINFVKTVLKLFQFDLFNFYIA